MYGTVHPYPFEGFKMDFGTPEEEGFHHFEMPSMRVNNSAVERLVPVKTGADLAVQMDELRVC